MPFRERFFPYRSGLKAKLIVPFVGVLTVSIILLGTILIANQKTAMTDGLIKKSEILVQNLAAILAEPFSAGEYDRIQQILLTAKRSDEEIAYAVLVATDGRVAASTDMIRRYDVGLSGKLENDALGVAALARRSTSQKNIFEIMAPVSLRGTQAGVLKIGISTQGVAGLVRQAYSTFIGVGLISLAFGIFLYIYVAGRVALPLLAMVERFEQLAEGTADLTLRLPVNSGDEVGQLARAFNTYLDSLGRMIERIRNSSQQIGSSSKSLSEITQQSSANIAQAVQVMSQISQSTSHVAQSAQRAASSAQQAGVNAQRGGKLATQVVEKMKAGQVSVAAATGYIHGLGKRSNQIGKIVDVITKIADQTNLLSLNAAIEAARAGELGRGFAVVADEIRKLAETSADSTQQIIALIVEVQEETKRAIETTEKGNREVSEGYNMVLEAEKLFSAIASEVAQMNLQMSQVASNTEQVAASTQEATASSEEQSAAMEQVANSTQEMARIIQTLRSLVEQFKTR
ncbi:MAG: hypothetical protein A3J74_09155 [Elusimicrobia bacterium RIFCSPHIGHO2_02_FULL_57_9]|nr:MAG: hypothetical protein A3J74_09155 [Elusimicrobia bacterium RIFCSPHIGHO2_02_FULL_57_9]